MLNSTERLDLLLSSCNISDEVQLETFLSDAGLSLGRFDLWRWCNPRDGKSDDRGQER